jgi:ubiquitin-protein ligase
MATNSSLLSEIRAINSNFKDLYAGQAEIEIVDDDIKNLKIFLMPSEGDFAGARIPFQFLLPANWPNSAPRVRCLTKIYHPNIDFSGSVCFNMLGGDGYSDQYTLETFINGMLWLLDNPNPDSCLNSSCCNRNPEDRRTKVQLSMRGLLDSTPEAYIQDNQPPIELGPESMHFVLRHLQNHFWDERPPYWTYKPSPQSGKFLDVLIRGNADFKCGAPDPAFQPLYFHLFQFRLFSRCAVLSPNEEVSRPNVPFLGPHLLTVTTDNFPADQIVDLLIIEPLPAQFRLEVAGQTFHIRSADESLNGWFDASPQFRAYRWADGRIGPQKGNSFELLRNQLWSLLAYVAPFYRPVVTHPAPPAEQSQVVAVN